MTVGVSVVTRDITDKRRLENRLAISDRMASVGTLAAGVAHEINNPLAAVMANLELIHEEITQLEDQHVVSTARLASLREFLTDASAGSERIRLIVRDLKLFSRPDEERRGAIDVRTVLDSSARMAWNEIRHRAQLTREFADVPLVWGNDSRLGQVFLNLIVNAAHAIREGNAAGNAITLRARTDDTGRAIVEVSDTGEGIRAEHLPNVFEPFFTTKPIGVGTGLGLSICQRIVHELGGHITVESRVGHGTTFRVSLPPTAKEAAAAVATRLKPMSRPPRSGRILVVDDEPMIAAAVQRSLRREHEVTVVTAAHDALERITRGERFDVILCDLMMPQMTGMELHDALRASFPDQAEAMVFLTGGAFSESASAFLDSVANSRVDKPFTSEHLRALLRERVG